MVLNSPFILSKNHFQQLTHISCSLDNIAFTTFAVYSTNGRGNTTNAKLLEIKIKTSNLKTQTNQREEYQKTQKDWQLLYCKFISFQISKLKQFWSLVIFVDSTKHHYILGLHILHNHFLPNFYKTLYKTCLTPTRN